MLTSLDTLGINILYLNCCIIKSGSKTKVCATNTLAAADPLKSGISQIFNFLRSVPPPLPPPLSRPLPLSHSGSDGRRASRRISCIFPASVRSDRTEWPFHYRLPWATDVCVGGGGGEDGGWQWPHSYIEWFYRPRGGEGKEGGGGVGEYRWETITRDTLDTSNWTQQWAWRRTQRRDQSCPQSFIAWLNAESGAERIVIHTQRSPPWACLQPSWTESTKLYG